VRRLFGAAALLLAQIALQISGFQNRTLAIILFGSSGILMVSWLLTKRPGSTEAPLDLRSATGSGQVQGDSAADVGAVLMEIYNEGAELKFDLLQSDENISFAEAARRVSAWRKKMVELVSKHVSTGKAGYIDNIPSIKDVDILGLPDQPGRQYTSVDTQNRPLMDT
jgi:hypothetical protein